MSKLILDKLKVLKPLIKGKGLPYEKYGVVKDGVLYFGNGFIQAEIPIDIPFDCCIDLYQLETVLRNVKGESVIINKDNKVFVHYDETDYNIETLSIDSLNHTINFFNTQTSVKCDESPCIFKWLCGIAEGYVQPIGNEQNVDFLCETLIIHNGTLICTDKYNIIQGVLDFNMPTMALPLSAIIYFNKIKKEDIVGMGLVNEFLLIEFSNGLKFYMPNLAHNQTERIITTYNRLVGTLDRVWEVPNVEIPVLVKEQISLINKISLQNAVFFNNTFCRAENSEIHYPSFTNELFIFKCLYRHLKVALFWGTYFKTSEKGMSFLSESSLIRGYIGKVLDD
mgnify:FL=1